MALYDCFVESPKFQNLQDHRKQGYMYTSRLLHTRSRVNYHVVQNYERSALRPNSPAFCWVEYCNWKHWCERCPWSDSSIKFAGKYFPGSYFWTGSLYICNSFIVSSPQSISHLLRFVDICVVESNIEIKQLQVDSLHHRLTTCSCLIYGRTNKEWEIEQI